MEPDRDRWTEAGVECYRLGADCDKCQIFKILGRRKEGPNPCYQAQSNNLLIEKGIMPSRSVTGLNPVPLDGKLVSPVRPFEKLNVTQTPILREEIANIVQALGTASYPAISEKLNRSEFMGFNTWNRDKIFRQMGRMVEAGVLKQSRITDRYGCRSVFEIADVGRLPELIRVYVPPAELSEGQKAFGRKA